MHQLTHRLRWIVLMPLFFAVACGSSKDSEKKPAGPAAMAVTVTQPARQILARHLLASGTIAPFEDMQLGVELSGLRVREVRVDVGARVRRGEVLLTLDARGVQSGLQQAEALLQEAEAGVLLAETNLKRGKEMQTRKLISAAEFDQLMAARVQASAREATARAARDAARLQVEYATLRAPDDGVISKRHAQPGMVVMAGAELFRLIRGNRLEWRAELNETDLLNVKPGQLVLLKDSKGEAVEGTLRAASPGVDAASRTGMVMFALRDPKALRIGMFVEGRIELGSGEVLVIPQAAVVRRDGYPYAFTIDAKNNTAKRVRLRLGHQDADWIEVLEGLDETQRVITSGAGFLSDGDAVRVVSTP